jgi:signal transduction histidine kinase
LHNQYKTKEIAVNRFFDAEQSLINGNSPRLCQVFINLIKNSIDALGEKPGAITIKTVNQDNSDLTVSSGEYGYRRLICSIADTGQGIDKKTQKDIFKPFFTTKEQGRGIGLGLFIVFEIVKDHLGTVEVESIENQGTTITLSFPCHSQ